MKAGFKPKSFTKEEWQNARPRKCKGSGVGKALKAFQDKCTFDLSNSTREQCIEAMKVCNTLKSALDKAKSNCDKISDSLTIKGIDQYHYVIDRYKKCLALTSVSHVKRKNLSDSLKLDMVLSDALLTKYFTIFAKSKKGLFGVPLETYLLTRKGKIATAVKKYSGDNDYNVSGQLNKALIDVYLNGIPVDQLDRKKHRGYVGKNLAKKMISSLEKMLKDPSRMKAFRESEYFQKVLDSKFPLMSFSI